MIFVPDLSEVNRILSQVFRSHFKVTESNILKDEKKNLVLRTTIDEKSRIIKLYRENNSKELKYYSLIGDKNSRCYQTQDGQFCVLLIDDLGTDYDVLSSFENTLRDEVVEDVLKAVCDFHQGNFALHKELLLTFGVPSHLLDKSQYVKHINQLENDFQKFRSAPFINLGKNYLENFEKAIQFLSDSSSDQISFVRGGKFTFIHGDLNVCNIYVPKKTNAVFPKILDFEAIRLGSIFEDLFMLLVHDFYGGYEKTLSRFRYYLDYRSSKYQIGTSTDETNKTLKIVAAEALFFPMKLFAHAGVRDSDLVMKSVDFFDNLVKNKPDI